MGACFSQHPSDPSQTAKVIAMNGELHEYDVPVTVSAILRAEACLSTSSSCFVCNSDGLYYEEHIPALSVGEELVENQIYFVLPEEKLRSRMTGSDMAALAVKASVALQKAAERGGRRRRRRTQISPVLGISGGHGYKRRMGENGVVNGACDEVKTIGRFDKGSYGNGPRVSRSGSFRKLQRLPSSSKRLKLAVRSFRTRLSTIYEGSVM